MVARKPKDATGTPKSFTTADSFTNFAAKLGIGTGNLSDASGYGFNFITRQRTGLEAAYRGSWIVGAGVDYPADDMTSSGVNFDTSLDPGQMSEVTAAMRDLQVWQQLGSTIKWARLYGGAVGVLMIDGQKLDTPLQMNSIKKGQFRGIYPMDRWMLNPALGPLVKELGPDFGLPEFYESVALPTEATVGIGLIPGPKIHYSRVVRFVGIELPFQQRLVENMWGMSVIERFFDRLVAFDSATTGMAQLVFKAYVRTWKMKDLRNLIAAGGKPLEGVTKHVQFMAQMQSTEGISLIDMDDEFEALTYNFAGLDDVLMQMGHQLAGALEMPLTRLFGESPAGMDATGEGDMQTYSDLINKKQERDLRAPVTKILDVTSRSALGKPLPDGFSFTFSPIRQPTPEQRATIANTRTQAVVGAFDSGVVDRAIALKELKQGSNVDGMWTNINDKAIKDAESEPPLSEFTEMELNPPAPKVPVGPDGQPVKPAGADKKDNVAPIKKAS